MAPSPAWCIAGSHSRLWCELALFWPRAPHGGDAPATGTGSHPQSISRSWPRPGARPTRKPHDRHGWPDQPPEPGLTVPTLRASQAAQNVQIRNDAHIDQFRALGRPEWRECALTKSCTITLRKAGSPTFRFLPNICDSVKHDQRIDRGQIVLFCSHKPCLSRTAVGELPGYR